MPHKTLLCYALLTFSLFIIVGCGSPSSVRVIEGDQKVRSALTGSVYTTNQTIIVHVSKFDRLATLSNARNFPAFTFLETSDSEGNKSAILKTRESRPGRLGTADIVEGLPKINDCATPVSAAESLRLRKIYRDLDEK